MLTVNFSGYNLKTTERTGTVGERKNKRKKRGKRMKETKKE
jgi:hypothetical protein